MPKSNKTRLIDIEDAKNLLAKARTHWGPVQGEGVTKEELAEFEKTIKRAEEVDAAAGAGSLDELRTDYKDQFGRMRGKAELIAHNFKGVDAVAERDFGLRGSFPDNDGKLTTVAGGLPKLLKKYCVKLAGRGFKKAEQDSLLEVARKFTDALAKQPAVRGKLKAEAKMRADVFKALRHQARYIRKAGRDALRDDAARTEFDRIKSGPARKVLKPGLKAAKTLRKDAGKAPVAQKAADAKAPESAPAAPPADPETK